MSVAGRTTVLNNNKMEAGKPTITRALVKKIAPEMIVPTLVNNATPVIVLKRSFIIKNKEKNINAVSGLSIIFGRSPPGKFVVNPDITPVTTPDNI